jgi:hypothetical protein
VTDQVWDDPQRQRQVIGNLRQRHPDWMIMYGRYSKMFWAFPTFTVFPGNYFGSEDPADLDRRMMVAERELDGP